MPFTQGYALVVGVGADLPATVQDAEQVAAFLRDPARCAYPPEQVTVLTNAQASRASVRAGLAQLAQDARTDPQATVVVYLSGHGVATPHFAFLTHGYDLQNLPATAIAEAELSAALRAIPAQRLLVLLDCCHAGGQVTLKSPAGVALSPALPATVLTELGQGGGRVVLASSRQDERSYIMPGDPLSLFTKTLLEALAGYGTAEQDGYARVLDVAGYVARLVPSRYPQQHPIISASHADNFALAYYAGGQSQPKAVAWDAQQQQPILLDTRNTDVRAWQTQLKNYEETLRLYEERFSQYVNQIDIPLQQVRDKRGIEQKVRELRQKLGLPEV
ncbi:MAG: caspase family protein [Chloroflexaceae bacterium]|nr:caspase family protein [Chloroflexaceae bacterium]